MAFRQVLQQLQCSLKSFQESKSTLRIVATVDPSSLQIQCAPKIDETPRTLFILDSSFNPPSIAHQTLAETALLESNSSEYEKPHRLLLLFSTMNADKAASAASFDQRLTMMAIFATDLLKKLKDSRKHSVVPIDVGITTAPYYTDKSQAIESAGPYSGNAKHVHLLGYDTLVRVFAAKYYSDFNPPFSALEPYFGAGHELRATLRPGEIDLDQQRAFLKSLQDGSLLPQGGKPEWAKQVHLIPPNPKAGVSSTKIRDAAKKADWQTVKQLCPPSIAQWVQEERLYD